MSRTTKSATLRYLSTPRFVVVVVLFAGVLGMLALPFLSNPFALVYPPALLAAGSIALFSNVSLGGTTSLPRIRIPTRALIAAYGFITAALLVAFATAGTRTPAVYLLTLCLYLVSVVSLFACSGRTALILVLCTAVVHRGTMAFAGPTVFGNDTLFHMRMAEQIASTGTREPLGRVNSHYYPLPGFHILVAATKLVGFDTRTAGFLAVTLPYAIVPSGLIYGLTNRLENERVAVLAVLLFITTDYALGWSVMPSTTALGLVLFSVGLFSYLLILSDMEPSTKRLESLLLVASVALVFIHHLSSVLFIFTLGTVWLGGLIQGQINRRYTLLVGMVIGAIVSGRLLFATLDGVLGQDTGFLPLGFAVILYRLATTSLFNRASIKLPDYYAVSGADTLTWEHTAGGAVLVFFGILGMIWKIRSESGTKRRLIYTVGVVVGGLYALTFGGPLVGIRYLQPMRFFQFIFIPLAVLAAFGLCGVVQRIKWSRLSFAAIVGIILLGYISLMGATFIGSVDDPILSEAPGSQRYEMSEQEHALYQHATMVSSNSAVVGDHLASVVVSRHYGGNSSRILLNHDEKRIQYAGRQPILVMVRPVVYTDHNAVSLFYQGRTFNVNIPLPVSAINCESSAVVYESGNQSNQLRQLPPDCLTQPPSPD